MSKLDDCIKNGQIRKFVPSKENAIKEIERAKRKLEEARIELKMGLFDSCLIVSYISMFHAARSLLVKDGFREKGHYCVARYLEEEYANKGKFGIDVVYLLDRFRELRHEEMYGVDYAATESEAAESVKSAEFILKSIEKLIE